MGNGRGLLPFWLCPGRLCLLWGLNTAVLNCLARRALGRVIEIGLGIRHFSRHVSSSRNAAARRDHPGYALPAKLLAPVVYAYHARGAG